MQFARKIVEPAEISQIIDLPEELTRTKLEIIVLPFTLPFSNRLQKTKRSKDIIDKLLASPVKIGNFIPFSREEIYER